MTHFDVNLSSGLPETVLPDPPGEATEKLLDALRLEGEERYAALGKVVANYTTLLDGWARLSESAPGVIESYAFARVGYHRGLDGLRKSGWKGAGYVRWSAPGNRGFLRCLENLRRRAEEIGEVDEAERCSLFLRQLDPDWAPSLLD